MFNTSFSENYGIYEIMCTNTENPDRPKMIVRCMHIECWSKKSCNHAFRICNIIHFILEQLLL